jgi:hypothetical protein
MKGGNHVIDGEISICSKYSPRYGVLDRGRDSFLCGRGVGLDLKFGEVWKI